MYKAKAENKKIISGLLVDTCWFAMTNRLSDIDFNRLINIRKEQGFSAIQVVVGIPPEVGSKHECLFDTNGTYYFSNECTRQAYLDRAKQRVQYINNLGLKVIIYGAWGHHIDLLGEVWVKSWWLKLIETFDELDVIYCVSGECDLWIGMERLVETNRSTDNLASMSAPKFLFPIIGRIVSKVKNYNLLSKKESRLQKWNNILELISSITERNLIVHTTPELTSHQALKSNNLLYAMTVQTGHSEDSRNFLWELPLKYCKVGKFINLEPWYEGIRGSFYSDHQLYAYWSSMMAGCDSYCYGAHGIWNVGDGEFLAHWGRQTFEEALQLNTPYLIGASHRFFTENEFSKYEIVRTQLNEEGLLLCISRTCPITHKFILFIPEIENYEHSSLVDCNIFDPREGSSVATIPTTGPIVLWK